MNLYKKYHISIGSNIGDRLINIQSSIDLIHSRIASLTAISSVYNSKSIGFEGDDFYNICASLTTDIGPHDVMQQLLEIEKILGRNRINEKKYISRKIDIDILLIEDLIIDSEELTIPHVEMCNRKFVLDPLIEIDPNLIHPIKKISLREIPFSVSFEKMPGFAFLPVIGFVAVWLLLEQLATINNVVILIIFLNMYKSLH